MRQLETSKDRQDIRSFLLANVEVMLENIGSRRKNNQNPSEDIFAETVSNQNIHWQRKYQPRPRLQILKEEKNSLGIYMTGNPLEDYITCLNYFVTLTGQKDLQIAIVDKTKKIFTKAGNMMFALQLTLVDQGIEGVIFSKKATDLSPILEDGELYWVLGKVSQRQAEKKASAEELAVVEESQSFEIENEIISQNSEESQSQTSTETEIESDNPDTEAEIPSAPVLEVAEYVEKPKFLINGMVRFQDGLRELFNRSEVKSKDKILNILPDLDWARMKEDPSSFPEFEVKSKKSRSRQSYSTDPSLDLDDSKTSMSNNFNQDEHDNFDSSFYHQDQESESETESSSPITLSNFNSVPSLDLPEVVQTQIRTLETAPESQKPIPTLKITRSLGPKAAIIKASLKKEAFAGAVQVEVWIENTQSQLVKAKGNYWIDRELVE